MKKFLNLITVVEIILFLLLVFVIARIKVTGFKNTYVLISLILNIIVVHIVNVWFTKIYKGGGNNGR